MLAVGQFLFVFRDLLFTIGDLHFGSVQSLLTVGVFLLPTLQLLLTVRQFLLRIGDLLAGTVIQIVTAQGSPLRAQRFQLFLQGTRLLLVHAAQRVQCIQPRSAYQQLRKAAVIHFRVKGGLGDEDIAVCRTVADVGEAAGVVRLRAGKGGVLHDGGDGKFAVFQAGLSTPQSADGEGVPKVQFQRLGQQPIHRHLVRRGGQLTLQHLGVIHGVGKRLDIQYAAVAAHLGGAVGIVGTLHGGHAVQRGHSRRVVLREAVGKHHLQIVVPVLVQIAIHGLA